MKRNYKKTTGHERKVLTISLLIYIFAILFAIVLLWIYGPEAFASSNESNQASIVLNSNNSFTEIPLTTCQNSSKTYFISTVKPELPGEAKFRDIIDRVSEHYPNISSEVIRAIVWHESRFQPNVHNGKCVGLMQVSTKWHANRAAKLGVTNFYDPYSNILVGVDYLDEITTECGDLGLALMIYNGDSRAYDLYFSGELSNYADGILTMANALKGEQLNAEKEE